MTSATPDHETEIAETLYSVLWEIGGLRLAYILRVREVKLIDASMFKQGGRVVR